MRILHLMPYSPVPPTFGGALRMYHMLLNLSRRHEVTVMCYGTAENERDMISRFDGTRTSLVVVPQHWSADFRRLGQLYAFLLRKSFFHMLTHREQMQSQIDRVLADRKFDLVQSEFPMMASFRLNTDAVKILDAHNVEYENFRQMSRSARSIVRKLHYQHESRRLYNEEINACRSQDAMFVTSINDKHTFDSVVPEIPKYVIPNGVDASYFHPSHNNPEPYSLVFTGMMGYVPNYDGILFFLDQIFPRIQQRIPDARIYVVGNRPPKELVQRSSPSVIVTGYVDDVRPYIHRASVYVVPLRLGSGTRLKILEAMAMKKPIVTTSKGCEGIQVEHGHSAFIEDQPESFAERVVQLMEDISLRQSVVRAAYDLVMSRYEWSNVGEEVERAYQELVMNKRTSPVLDSPVLESTLWENRRIVQTSAQLDNDTLSTELLSSE